MIGVNAADNQLRRVRRPRTEIQDNLIDAALRLLDDHHPDDLTSRQIASEAQEHLRYISDFFGSQAGLFAAALPRAINEAVTDITPSLPKDTPPPRIVICGRGFDM